MSPKTAIIVLLFSLSVSAAAQDRTNSDARSAKFGDLAVTATEMNTRATTKDRRGVTVFLTVNNTGKSVVCASFTAKLETTFNLEYGSTPGQALVVREMLPGESARGSYDFDVKDGVQPLALVLELQGRTIRCGTSRDTPSPDTVVPTEVRLDVHDLPSPKINDQTSGAFRAGTGGVGNPSCLYCPEPQYTEAARKAKWQGTVVLQVVVTPDGRATNIEVVKSPPGLGVEDKAIEAVKTWRFKPALGPEGKPVAVTIPLEVLFRLL
jgi:TonB family protein